MRDGSALEALNPPWATRIFGDARDAILAKAQSLGLPMPTGMKAEDELGCGHYGCVYRTEKPGVVFKITTDASEAFFVGLWRKWFGEDESAMPAGIVRYYAVFAIPGVSHRKRNAYVLWREEAHHVGDALRMSNPAVQDAGVDAGTIKLSGSLLTNWLLQARAFRAIEQRRTGRDDYWQWIERQTAKAFSKDDQFEDWYWGRIDQPIPWFLRSGARYEWKAAWHLYVMSQIAEEMVQTDYIYPIGEVFRDMLGRRVVMADVHEGNIGHVNRPDHVRSILAITDPGHVISLDRRNASSEVPSL